MRILTAWLTGLAYTSARDGHVREANLRITTVRLVDGVYVTSTRTMGGS